MIKFNCTNCGTILNVADNLAGKQDKCPKCGNLLNVPASKEELAPPQMADTPPAKQPKKLLILGGIAAALVLVFVGIIVLVMTKKDEPAENVITNTPPKKITLDLGNGVSMKLVLIPAGKFMMGSRDSVEIVAKKGGGKAEYYKDEYHQHEVTISKPFYMGIYEVTQEQYQAIMGKNPSYFKGDKNPVEEVSWNDVIAFCKALSSKTGRSVHLPTEAQWEYACRAGMTTPFNTGETISTDQANYNGAYPCEYGKKGVYRFKTIPVGSFKPNAFGLHNMHGNVWEWCSDYYGEDYYTNAKITDPQGPDSGLARVVRGGSWVNYSKRCRSSIRFRFVPDYRDFYGGFRVVVDLK